MEPYCRVFSNVDDKNPLLSRESCKTGVCVCVCVRRVSVWNSVNLSLFWYSLRPEFSQKGLQVIPFKANKNAEGSKEPFFNNPKSLKEPLKISCRTDVPLIVRLSKAERRIHAEPLITQQTLQCSTESLKDTFHCLKVPRFDLYEG